MDVLSSELDRLSASTGTVLIIRAIVVWLRFLIGSAYRASRFGNRKRVIAIMIPRTLRADHQVSRAVP